ncbi:hypothetical protein B0H13DRAFT_2056536 [Mycena leptocephala]|nr:hypothetical protein B0H13DRAFT_2056536 [Mycena leptocephala]
MSTLKLPLLLAVALGTHLTMTPPHPPPLRPSSCPRAGSNASHQSLLLSCTLSESLVLLAQHLLSFPFARRILATLDPATARPGLRSRLYSCLVRHSPWLAPPPGNCYTTLRTLFTFELGIRADHRLITTGLYAVVRHPELLRRRARRTGIVMCTLAPGSWAVECTGLVGPRSLAALWVVGFGAAGRFGKEWEDWATRVPCWIVPGVY